MLRAPESTVRYWRHIGTGPPSAKVGRRVLYRREAVLAWLLVQEEVASPPGRLERTPLGLSVAPRRGARGRPAGGLHT
ncbi:helix-turn-helix domain-containing protein, partial [Psychroserpens jangbogonensis]|uniref:helix-turn-helix domain-containing protein n=1 Tax=Psychroserpens jangbogonensis TaxID=1484460 RepID=UPI00137926BC